MPVSKGDSASCARSELEWDSSRQRIPRPSCLQNSVNYKGLFPRGERPRECIGRCSRTRSGSFFIFHSRRDGDATVRNLSCGWKTQFSAGSVLLWIGTLLLPLNAFCNRIPKTVPDGLKVDYLGETLKEYRSVHPKAICLRERGEWAEEDPGKTWLLWIHCSLDTGVTVGGYKLLSESDPRYPFGAYATFHRKRLVTITYTLSTGSLESLVSLMGRDCGWPLNLTKDDDGVLRRAFCTTRRFSVVLRSIPIQALTTDNRRLEVTSEVLVFATSVTITAGDETEQ
jgi:hypothetical protein